MKKYISPFLFLLIATNLFAEGASLIKVSGIVKSASNNPLDYVSVYVKGTHYAAFSDTEGKFSLEIPGGKQNLTFSLLGFETKTLEIFPEKLGKQTLNITLNENAQNLTEVLVMGKSEGRKLKETGLAVNIIEMKEIAVQSVQTNELLDRTAGVRIRQDGGLGSKVNYNINGLSGNSIRIFIDGVPASNYGSSFSLSSIPPALIERIEVYKGVVPGYLSEDALGGAINIVLKHRRDKSLSSSYSIGSFNTHQWNLAGSYRWKKGLTFDASAFYNYSDNSYKVWGKDIKFTDTENWHQIDSKGEKVRRFHDAYKSFGGKLNVGFTKLKWADQFMFGVVLSQTYKEIQNGATMQLVYGDRHSRRKSDVFTLNYAKKDFLLNDLSLKIDASYSFLNRQTIDTVGIRYDWLGAIIKDGSYLYHINSGEIGAEAGGAKTNATDKDYAAMIRANLNYRIKENHRFYLNYMFNDFRRKVSDDYKPAALQALANTRDLQKNIFAFTYEMLAFSGSLRTNVFYKHYFQKVRSNEPQLKNNEYLINQYEKSIDHGAYGLTLSYALLPDLYLLASGERALRLPNANELFGNGSENSLAAVDLKPENSLNANLGFNYGFKIKKHSFGINSSVYLRDTKDMIRMTLNGNQGHTYAENLESVFTRGIDAELTYNYANKFDFRFNISKFDVLFNTKYDASGNPYNFYRLQIKNEPSFKFNGQFSYFIDNLFLKKSRSSIYYNISYVNGFYRHWSNVGTKNQDYIPLQYPMDVGFTYAFPKNKLVLSFDAKNILDQQLFDNFGLQKPGRAFYAKITYSIF